MADTAMLGQALLNAADIDSMFEKYTVNELHDIEKAVRREIEKKKEDVRQMVGERYRDLIEAADTITEMKKSICSVTRNVSSMEEQCLALDKKEFVTKNQRLNEKKAHVNAYYNLAAHIKLLLDIPAKIWCLMESNQYLSSAELFLLAKHINTAVQLEASVGIPVSSWFPVITRQWITTSHFKTTLIDACRNALKNVDADLDVLIQSFCALLILNGSSVSSVFDEFLRARLECVKELFLPDRQNATLKQQICHTVKLLIWSLKFIFCLFLKEDEGSRGMLEKQLNRVCNPEHSQLSKHLSIATSGVLQTEWATNIALPQISNGVHVDNLREKCTLWLLDVKNELNTNVADVVKFISTVKGLAVIHDSTRDLISENKLEWDTISAQLLQGSFHLWNDNFHVIFLKRVREIVELQMNRAFYAICSKLTDNITKGGIVAEERNFASFLWLENTSDFPRIPSTSKIVQSSGNLGLKARGFTSLSRNLCSLLESQLKSLLDDVNFYIESASTDVKEDVSGFLQLAVNSEIDKLLKVCDKIMEDEPADIDDDYGKYLMSCLFLARFLVGLTELCPALQMCAPGKIQNLNRREAHYVDDLSWESVNKLILDKSRMILRRWKTCVIKRASRDVHRMRKTTDLGEFLYTLPHWESINIEEENENGNLVLSTIRIPSQVSWTLMKVLHCVCAEINAAGAHFLPRVVLQEIQTSIAEVVVECYESTVQERINQVFALQLLFDLNFICALTSAKDDNSLNERIQKLTDFLESFVDPFDLDVFTPYIQTNLKLSVHRSSILLGALVSSSKVNLLSSVKRVPTNSTEQHDVLCLNSSIPRFSLLPLANNFELTASELSTTFTPKYCDN